MSAAPRLRSDLVIREQTTATRTSVVVKDPATKRFFRLGPVECFVVQQLDGKTSFDVIRDRVEARFGQPLPAETLTRFIEQFRRHRLLEEGVKPTEYDGGRQWVRGSPLYIRVKAFDPDRLLGWLLPHVNVLFTRTFLVTSAATLLSAVGIAATSWPEVARDLTRLYRFDALLLAWATVLSVTVIHELAHGVTCKRFGGQVDEIGFMLLQRSIATSATPG